MPKVRILAVSDRVESRLYNASAQEQFAGVDLLVGCGDLPPDYLEFLVTLWNVPLIYVPGNHDVDDYAVPGGINLDGRVEEVGGLLVAGLGGSLRYKAQGRHQYTQRQMDWRVGALLARLWVRRALAGRRRLDLFISHASPWRLHDRPDLAHTGFRAFHSILHWARPAIYLHGHHHAVPNLEVTDTTVHGTRLVNVFPFRWLQVELGAPDVD